MGIFCLNSDSAVDEDKLNDTVDAFDNLKHENIVVDEIMNKSKGDDSVLVEQNSGVALKDEKDLIRKSNEDILYADGEYTRLRDSVYVDLDSIENIYYVGDKIYMDWSYKASVGGMSWTLYDGNSATSVTVNSQSYTSYTLDDWHSGEIEYEFNEAKTYNFQLRYSSGSYYSNTLTYIVKEKPVLTTLTIQETNNDGNKLIFSNKNEIELNIGNVLVGEGKTASELETLVDGASVKYFVRNLNTGTVIDQGTTTIGFSSPSSKSFSISGVGKYVIFYEYEGNSKVESSNSNYIIVFLGTSVEEYVTSLLLSDYSLNPDENGIYYVPVLSDIDFIVNLSSDDLKSEIINYILTDSQGNIADYVNIYDTYEFDDVMLINPNGDGISQSIKIGSSGLHEYYAIYKGNDLGLLPTLSNKIKYVAYADPTVDFTLNPSTPLRYKSTNIITPVVYYTFFNKTSGKEEQYNIVDGLIEVSVGNNIIGTINVGESINYTHTNSYETISVKYLGYNITVDGKTYEVYKSNSISESVYGYSGSDYSFSLTVDGEKEINVVPSSSNTIRFDVEFTTKPSYSYSMYTYVDGEQFGDRIYGFDNPDYFDLTFDESYVGDHVLYTILRSGAYSSSSIVATSENIIIHFLYPERATQTSLSITPLEIISNSIVSITPTVTYDSNNIEYGKVAVYINDEIMAYVKPGDTYYYVPLTAGTYSVNAQYMGVTVEGYPYKSSSNEGSFTVTERTSGGEVSEGVTIKVTNVTYGMNPKVTISSSDKLNGFKLFIDGEKYCDISLDAGESTTFELENLSAKDGYVAGLGHSANNIAYSTIFNISKTTPILDITVNGNNTLTSDPHSIVVNTLGSGKIKINSDSTLYNIGQTINLNNLDAGINSIYVNYTGDENYSSVVKTIIFNTYALYPSSISITLNETGIKKGALIRITPVVTVMSDTINKGNVAFYYKNETLIDTINLEDKSYLDFTPIGDEGAEITIYAKYLGYNDLGYAESENSNEESFKIKKALVINLTVTGLFDGAARIGSSSNGPFYVFYADTGDYSPILEVYDTYYDDPCLYDSNDGKQGNSEIDSFYFNTNELGNHEVYVKFLGDDEYLPSESNHVLFTVYQSRDVYYNGGIELNPNYGLDGTTVSIMPKVYYTSSSKEYLSNGILKVYSDSSKNNLIASIDISRGDSFDYEFVSTSSYYNYNTIYATFEGVNGDYYYYNQYTLSARFYIMNENSFSLTGNSETGTIEINSGDTITLSADIAEYRFDRSSGNSLVCIYIDDVNVANFTGVYSSSYNSYSVSDYNFDFTGYSAGQHIIYAEYLGYVDTSYNYYYAYVRSNNLTIKILQDTSISLYPSLITAVQGDNEQFITASVTTNEGSVDVGNITYFDNGVAIEGYTNVAVDTKLYLTNLAIGSHTITAQYLGNDAYKPSAMSEGVSVVVQKVDGFSISVTSPNYPTTAIATVTGDEGETYTITIVGLDKSFDVTIAEGETQVTQDLGVLGVNSTWKAVVSHGGKTNETTFSVNKGTPILTITVNGNETLISDLHNITVSTQGSGKITLNDDSTKYNIGDVIVLADLTVGSNKITVKYDGDENYTNVEKDIYFTLYDKYSTTITLTLNETSITKGGSILVTPSVKNQKGDDVEGRVTFYFDAENPIETIDLAKTKNITITPSASGSIYAVFLENDTLTTSTSSTVEFTVNKKTVNTIVTLELNTDELLSSGQIIVTPHVVGVNGEEVDAGSFTIKDVSTTWDNSGQITRNINLGDTTTINPPYNGIDPSKNPYNLYVWYNGGTGQEYIFAGSKSDSPTQYYHVYSNSLSLTADGGNEVTAYVGDSITLYATLTQGSDVKLFIDGVLKGTISANSDSVYEITSDLIGNHNISVKYERTGYYASALSNNVTLHISERVIPEFSLSADREFTYNKLITVTPSIEVTEGTITYFINGKANKTLNYNVPFTVSGLTVADNYNITAVYNEISGVNASVFINVTKAVNNIRVIIEENNILPDSVTVNVTADVGGTYHVVINETYSVDVECNTTQTINLPAGLNYNATTSFSDEENYTVNIVNAIFNVKKANVTLTITGVNNNPTYEDENIINVAVSSGDINNVIYLENNVQIGSGDSLDVSKLSATNHIITVRYVEDDNYNQKEETVTINVGKKAIDVNVIVNDNIYPNNLAIILESSVNGTYTVTIGDHSSITTINNGKNASLSISGLSSAIYGANIASVSIDNDNYTINQVTSNSFTVFTQTNVDLELNTTHVSQNGFILITPKINGGEITTGSVEFYDNNQLIATVDLSQNKNYSYRVTGVKGSLHNLSAKYLANGIYTISESENKTYNIKDTLILSLERIGEELAIKSGDNVTFTFTIHDSIRSLVKLMVNDNEVPLSENITFTNLGDNEVYLSFCGNDYYEAVNSNSVVVKVVTPIVPTVTLVLNTTDLFENNKIKVTTIVKNGDDLITVGQVTISDNVGNQKTVTAGEDVEFDVETFDTTKNPYSMSATYGGFTNASLIYAQASSIDYEFNHSISNAVSLSANVSEIYVGQSIEFTASCTGSEDVKLYLGNEENSTFVDGKVTIQFNKSGTYVFKAVYLRGSGAYISANSTEVTITVKDKIDTALTFDGETSITYGNNLTLTPKVNNGDVSVGEITYYDENNVEIKTLDVSQLFTYNATNVKSYTFKAKYSGNYMYKESEATITFTVNKADNNVNIIIEGGSYPDNVSVKLTATVDGTYKVDVNGTVFNVVANGDGVSYKFGAGLYQAKIIDYTNDYYNLVSENKDFTVLKGTNSITVEILSSDIKYGDEVIIKVTASVAGVYTVKYNGSEIKVDVSTNGGSGINKTAKLSTVGHYYANVTWSNDNYTASISNATFDVLKAVNTIKIEVSDVNYPELVQVNVTATLPGTYKVKFNNSCELDVEVNEDGKGSNTIRLNAGSYSANITYNDDNYAGDITNATFKVNKGDIELIADVINDAPNYGDDNSIYANITAYNITGSVVYIENGVEIGSSVINGTLDVSGLSAGEHKITVKYIGDDNYNAVNKTITINVALKPINVNVIISNALSTEDVKVIIESAIDGTYTVTIGGKSNSATINNGKNASLSISGLSSTIYDANIASVSIDNDNYAINQVNSNSFTVFTQTNVDLELNTTHVSQNGFILITPKVNGGEITTGSVELYDNNQLIASVDLSQNKNYSYEIKGVKGSLHNISAKYLANGIYTASESENKTYNIKDTLTLSLERVGDNLAIKSGDNVTFTFTIPDEIKNSVKLIVNNNEVSLSENVTFNTLGDNEVYLLFDGNEYYEAVNSSSVVVKVVTPIEPAVTLVLNTTDLFENAKIKVTTIVKNGDDLITVGQVTISDNVGNQKTVTAGEDVEFDVETFDTTKNPYSMSATYGGFTNASLIYAQSSSIDYEFNHSISNTVSLSANVSEIYVGQSIEFTAICAGSEDVKLYLANKENETFVGGKVTIQFNKYGTYVFKAVYLRGSGAYISANSTEVTVMVKDKIDTALTFDGETSIIYGNNLTLTPKVNNGEVNVGEITYYDENGDEITTLDVSKVFTYNASSVKSFKFTAKYNGNYMYKNTSADIEFTVNKADNIVNIVVASGNYPDNVTVKLTATVDGTYKVDVNGTVLNVVANGGGVSHKFGAGSYSAKIIDYTSDYYNLVSENKDFTVLKGTNVITVEILSSDIKYGDEVIIKVTASVAGIYTVKYNGSEIKVNVSTNGGSGINKTAKLTIVGHYYANVTWSNDNYTATINNATFDVLKAVNTIKIEVSDVNYPELVQVNVTATLPGTYKVKFNNSCELDVEVNEDGKGSNTIRLNSGSYSANITYNNDNYAGDITNATFKVNKGDIELIADVINNVPIYMDINSIYANITAYNITGSIVYIENGVEIGSSVINGTLDVSGLSAGEHKIIVKYIGDSNYNALNKTVIINVAPKTIDINITFSDGLSSEAIKAILESTLNGQYAVTVNGQSGFVSISNNKNATVEINGLTAGTYDTVTIDVDNTNYTVNIANKNSFTVYDAYPTSISFVLNASHVSKDGYILITPTVKDYQNNEIKEGSIEFGDGESSFTMDLSQNETYVYKITRDKGSYHTISAKYLGVENKYAESTASENKNYTIKKDLILTLERNGSNVAIISGDYVGFTITVSNESLKSDIKLFLNGEEIALSNHIQFNTLNDNVVYVSFEGNDDYDPVNSSQITVKVVNPITTYVTLTLNATELTENNKILITTKVVDSDNNVVSVGNVTIYDDNELITIGAGKNYNHTVSTLTTGKHNLNAKYNGFADENNVYLSSESINYEYLQVHENKLTLTVDRDDIYAGESVQFNATLKGGSGNIKLYLNNNLNTTLENGVLKSILFNQAGSYTFKAVYNTDEEYASINSTFVSINVNAKETTILTFDNAENVQFKNNISLTPSVKSGENIVNDGKIIYMENNEIIAIIDVTTVFNYTALTIGEHTITAKYNGTNRYMNSSATITFNVIKATNNVKVTVDTVYYPNAVDIIVEASIDGDYIISINSTVVSSVTVNVVDGRGNKSVILGAGNYSANITNNIENYTGELTNATFEVKKGEIELSISIPPIIVHSENVTGTVFSNIAGNYTVKIGNLDAFNVTIRENQATFNVGRLSVDKYSAEVSFAGNSNYNPKTTSCEFNVTQNGTSFNVTVIGGYEFTYGTPITINYTLPNDAKGNITIIYAINGTEIENIIVPETYTFYNLNARTYTIDVRYNGETNYPPITKQIQFTVKPAENHINVTVDGSKYPANVTINVTADVDDDYTININGKTVIVKVEDKKGSVSVKLASGEYYANIIYSNINYVGILKNTTFKVENGTNSINVTINSADYPNKVDIIVNATVDGIYTIKFNDTSFDSVEVNVNEGSGIKSINLPAGSYKTIVEYVNANYTNEITDVEFNINKGSVELISDAINNNPTYMDANSIYANITAYNITGSIVYIENGEEIGSGEINGTFDVSGLGAGEHKITVKYVGDSNYNAVNKTVTINVTPKPIHVNVIISDDLSGENVGVIIESNINGTYTVTIADKSNSTTINNGRNATLSIFSLSSAIYDANIASISIDNTNYTVDVVTSNSFTVFTQTIIDLELNTTHVSQNGFILIIPKVNGGEVTTGSVELYDNNQLIATVNLSQNKNYSYEIKGVKGSLHNVSAKYLSNGVYTASESENKTYNIKNTLTLSLERVGEELAIKSGDNATFKFTIPDTIQSFVKLIVNNNEVPLSENVTFTDLGENEVYLSFNGNDYYESINSDPIIVKVVNPIETSVRLVLNTTDLFENGKIKVTAYVEYVGGNVTIGNVIVKDDAGNQKTVITGQSVEFGVETFSLGTYQMSAVYVGIATNEVIYNSSTSDNYEFYHLSTNQVILHSNTDDIYVGQSVEFTASADGNENIELFLSNTYNATFVGGKVTIQFNESGTYKFKAVYVRHDGYYISANSSEVTIAVKDKIDTTLTFDGETSITYGNNLTLTPKINDGNAGVGNITYYDENGEVISTLDVSKVFSYNATNVNSFKFTARYNGNFMYKNSSADIEFTVNKANNYITVKVENVTYPNEVIINVTADLDGIYTVVIGENKYNVTVKDGAGNKSVLLAPNDYEATIIYDNPYYEGIITNSSFSVLYGVNNIVVVVENQTYHDEVLIKVNATLAGNYTVKLNNTQSINVEVKTAGGQGLNTTKLNAGKYTATVEYVNVNYTANVTNALFEVYKASNKIIVNVDGDVKFGKNATIVVTATIAGNYTINVDDGETLTVEIKTNGGSASNITGNFYKLGLYHANVTWSNPNYGVITQNATFEVIQGDNNIEIKVSNASYPNNVTINVTADVDGNYTIKFNNTQSVDVKVINHKGNATFLLPVGLYNATVEYNNDNYINNGNNVIFNVSIGKNNIKIIVEDVYYPDKANIVVEADVDGDYIIDINSTTVSSVKINVVNGSGNATVELASGKYSANIVNNLENYDGDINNGNFTVYKANTLFEIDSNATDNMHYGEVVKINYTIGENALGRIILSEDSKVLANITVGAEFDNLILSAGSHVLKVEYMGNENYSYISKELTVNIAQAVNLIELNITNASIPNNVSIKIKATLNGNYTLTIDKVYNIVVKDNVYVDFISLEVNSYIAKLHYADNNENYTSQDVVVNFKVFASSVGLNGTVTSNVVPINEEVLINTSVKVDDADAGVEIIYDDGTESVNARIGEIVHYKPLSIGVHKILIKYLGDNKYPEEIINLTVNVSKKINNVIINTTSNNYPNNITINLTADVDGEYNVSIADKTVMVKANSSVSLLITPGTYTPMLTYSSDIYDVNLTAYNFTISKAEIDLLDALTIGISDNGSNPIITFVFENTTGNITVKINNEIYNAILINGRASIVVSNLTVGKYNATVIYSGDDFYEYAEENITVNKLNGFSMNVTATSPVYGQESIVTVELPSDALGNVTITFGDETFDAIVGDGKAIIEVYDLKYGDNMITVSYNGDDNYPVKSINITIHVQNNIIVANSLTRGWDSGIDYQARVISEDGSPVAGITLIFTVDGEEYDIETDDNGYASFDANLDVGTYSINIFEPLSGASATSQVVIVSRIIANNDLTMSYLENKAYVVQIIGDDGNHVGAGVKVSFELSGKYYSSVTDINGYARLNSITKAPGKYTVTAEYHDMEVTNKIVINTLFVSKRNSKVKKSSINKKGYLLIKYNLGKYFKGKKISLKFKGKTYKAKVNGKGEVKLKINKKVINNLKVGRKYQYTMLYKLDKKNRYFKVYKSYLLFFS